MFAKVIYQNEEVKKKFYQKIKEKIEKECNKIKENDNSGFLAKLFGMTEVDKFDRKVLHDNQKGSEGENELKNQMWLMLKSDSYILPDYVFEVVKDDFIQIDNIVVNLKGIFLIEVKTWSGSFVASDNIWKMKQGKEWVKVENPTIQHKRHYNLFKEWFSKNAKELYQKFESVIYPVIVLKQVNWIQSKYSSIPVVSGAQGFIEFILEKPRGQLTEDLVQEIVEKLRTAKPIEEETAKITEGITKHGKRFVRIEGNKEEALKVLENYKGSYKVSNIYQDKNNPNIYFFYIDE